ncbi:MAG: phosphate signaling complex protein PhoU [Candidatus Cloacimonetes bacterium]|nr:phosphate signaling complex protein PhoU [Candidatus Cloacimonadota bacterium]
MIAKKIEELKKKIIEESQLVEEMLEKSIDGLLNKDALKLEEVFTIERKVNKKELDIDEMCTGIIALHQPEAKNLRTILMILKMNNDLERMGDLVVNIAECSQYLIRKPFIKKLVNIPVMMEETKKMLADSIKAFINGDIILAKNVCLNDDVVDDLKDQQYRLLMTYMIDDSTTIKRAILLDKISSYLERIADLSTNIAEETVFMTKGTVIKHHSLEED